MSEDKMREEHWRQWGIAGMPKDKIRLAEETWKAATEACAAIKDAEIASLHKRNQDLRDNALTNEQATYAQIERLVKERAARDLMIKELREALNAIADENSNHPIFSTDDFLRGMKIEHMYEKIARAALAKSEHHDSRALEKMLLEAELNGLSTPDFEFVERWTAVKVKLAELNKEN